MAKSRNSSMAIDFQVTFFSEDKETSCMLSEIIKNRDNSTFLETIGISGEFIFPFCQEERDESVVYTLQHNCNEKYEITLNGQPYCDRIVSSGDYFVLKSRSIDRTIKLLFIATSDIILGYKKYKIANDTNIFIGRTPINDISFDFTSFVSREKHAAIRIDSNGDAYIEDLKRSIGIYVNGRSVHSQQLRLYDEVFMMGLSIIYMGSFIAVRDIKTEGTLSIMDSFSTKVPIDVMQEKEYFVSTPRILKSLDNDEIEVDAPPSPFVIDKTPAILVVGPSLTMSLVMLASLGVSISNAIVGGELATVIASGTMAIGMLLGALMWPMLLRSYQKRRTLAEEKHRKDRYTSYIADIEKKLIAKRERTVRLLNDTLNPSPDALCSLLDSESNKLRLWERSYEDVDFLAIRMGLGNRLFDVQLKVPKQGFQLYEDELRKLPLALAEKYGVMSNVPLTLDMNCNHKIGIIGSQKNIYTILEEIILNIISLHAYDEVKLVLAALPKQAQRFSNYKNVPHIWSNDKKIRYFATTSDEVHHIFNAIDESIKDKESAQDGVAAAIPHYVLIVTSSDLVEKEALLRYMDDDDNKVGLTTVFAYGDITKLPKTCKTIIQSDETRTGYYIKNKNANRFIPFDLDSLNVEHIHTFASNLSKLPIKRDLRTLGIADRISFLQMYKVGNVKGLDIERHWDSNNSAKSLAAPIGVMAGGEIFSLDIHEAYHGCHGLVAGTTGSGKSEFLQAFILSLAINFSPKEVAFVLVDFKGGDMARPFMAKPFLPALPHLAATISNLSGNILYRALVSLAAEIKSRQRIFNETATILGVDKLDINSYHKYYKGGRLDIPLPHLVIIIDEFAQLKTQQPDFLMQLINVAQIGRSLGIHLILATQKPSGIVDPQIMSNSRFKVCLKVADKQDSIDIINRPDSAMIKNPGRLNLQVGYDEIYECVQSGYSGAEYLPTKEYMPDEEITVQMTDNTANPIHSAKIDMSSNKSDKTQLEAVVAEIVTLGQKKKISAKPLWLEVLSEKVVLNALKKGRKGLLTATIGLADHVRIQEQRPLTINFIKAGHIGLYGASGTGKTTFLQTLIFSLIYEYRYTPDELNLYAMDFGGRNLGYLEELPHTGGVVYSDDEDKVSELVSVLRGIIEERKRVFSNNNCGTFSDYHTVSKKALPAILVLIDNFAPFRDKYMDISDSFIDIISSGRTFGVFFVITGSSRNSIYYKVTEQISTYFTLKMNDPSNYLDIHNIRPPVTPEDISGRGITVINGEIVEFQTAIAFDAENEADRISSISKIYHEIANAWNGYEPIHLNGYAHDESSESESSMADFHSSLSKRTAPESLCDTRRNLLLGESKTGALLYGITLSEDYKVCVCSDNARSMANCYRIILRNIAQYSGRKLVFVDSDSGAYSNAAEAYPSCRYIKGVVALNIFIEELKPELNRRLGTLEEPFEPLFIIISEFNEFFNMITDEQAVFMRKLFQYINSPQYCIYFVCGFNVNGEKSNDRLFMSLVVNAENYLIGPNCYSRAASKIEALPILQDVNPSDGYICLKDRNCEIRW